MSHFLSLKLLATVGSKSRAVTRFRAAAATGARSNLVRHFSLGQALGVNLVQPEVVNFERDPPPEWDPNDPSHNNPDAPPSIAVILSGCGVKDGTDVHEAIYTMMHITRRYYKPICFAPTGRQLRVVDHFSNSVEADEYRYMGEESARMTWDRVKLLDNLRVEDHQGLIVPGGSGIGFNLTDYVLREPDDAHLFEMDETLYHKLLDFYRHRKPMGFLGIASILAARVFHGVRITFGDEATLLERGRDYLLVDAMRMEARHEDTPFYRVLHDTNYHIFSARASLADSMQYHELSRDIGNLVSAVIDFRLRL